MPPDRRSVPTANSYGKACSECARSKCKCVPKPDGGACERCDRLKKVCVPGQSSRARQAQRNNPIARLDQLEGKLDSIVSILGSNASLGAQSPAVGTPSPPIPSFGTSRSRDASVVPVPYPTGTLTAYELAPEQYLNYFSTHCLKYFPIIHLPPDTDAQQLRQTRPFLWICIVAAASQSSHHKMALGEKIKQEVTRRMFLDNHPSIKIDLLLGLLIFLAWGHNQILNSNPAQLARFTQLATTMVFDLRLNKPPQEESNMLPVSQRPFAANGQPHSLEERRAVLGCFVLSSIVSVYFGHIDPLQWTPYMDECAVALLRTQESPYDEMFVHQVRLQRIVGEVENVREASTASPDFYLKFLQQKVDEIKVNMPAQLQQNRILSATVYYTELSIFGLILSRKAPPGFQRLEYLYACLNTVQAATNNFLAIPVSDYPGISCPVFTQIVRYIIVLYKLSTLNDPVWDLNLVRTNIDVVQVIDQVIRNIEQAMAEVGDQCAGGSLERARDIFAKFKSWSLPNLPATTEALRASTNVAEEGDFTQIAQSNVLLDALFSEDWWLKDNLFYGLQVGGNMDG
ncbi:phosphoketolase 1 [Penicillium diatomitis]|uniref:Phosphoketolase 1 n=1 Tax=Penicillium diatomitis TaxID=2819901 RepID=A0A9X0BYY0_9EURO|nr:phosphoketolase 1 [Penicillium diatomitis]KAJ5491200.1 phosphoketolase 1 [Penicillium diatomitis]